MTKLWAVVILRRNNAEEEDCHTFLAFQSAETAKEAREMAGKDYGEYDGITGYTTVEIEAHLVPSNPAPPIPSWLSALKKGDIVHSEYGGELAPYELLEEILVLNRMGSGFGAWLLINGLPKLLDSGWIKRPLESFN